MEDFKNLFCNLALPLWIFSEPMPPKKHNDNIDDPVMCMPVKSFPKGFSVWDKLEIKGVKTYG